MEIVVEFVATVFLFVGIALIVVKLVDYIEGNSE